MWMAASNTRRFWKALRIRIRSPVTRRRADAPRRAIERPACPTGCGRWRPQVTILAFKTDLRAAAHSLLERLHDYPSNRENLGFQPSLLRYKVKQSDDVVRSQEYDTFAERGSLASKVISVTSKKSWYDDDDWLAGSKRLGASEDLELVPRKEEIERAMLTWVKEGEIRQHVEHAIDQLCPDVHRSKLSRYGVKFDLYTNRIAPGWHQDWDDGHALFIGLINLTRSETGELVSIKGAELLDFTSCVMPPSSLPGASEMRKNLMSSRACYGELTSLGEDQPFGEIRWFNDPMIVHRTPPYAANTLSRGTHDLQELNKTFSVGGQGFDLPNQLLTQEMRDSSRYNLNGPAPQTGRALLRITVRESRKHK